MKTKNVTEERTESEPTVTVVWEGVGTSQFYVDEQLEITDGSNTQVSVTGHRVSDGRLIRSLPADTVYG